MRLTLANMKCAGTRARPCNTNLVIPFFFRVHHLDDSNYSILARNISSVLCKDTAPTFQMAVAYHGLSAYNHASQLQPMGETGVLECIRESHFSRFSFRG